ncbi:ATP-binding protein, partial [bacterium]|nr:ATP-binding protein [bacterium]
MGDTERLRQILINLVANALKFTIEGKVVLRVFPVKDSHYCFQVIDTGIGIENSKIDSIFKNFSQVDPLGIPQKRGTGLGLSIVKNIVDIWSGQINVISKLKQGSTFSVTLPIQETQSFQSSPILDLETPSKKLYENIHGIKILCCENESSNIELIESVLEKYHPSMDLAINGQQGVFFFSNNSYDIVLMDISLPVINGMDACNAMRTMEKIRKLTPTPIIAVTADVFKEAEYYLNAGFDALVTKPYTSTDIYEIISSTLKENKTNQMAES